MSLNPHHQVPLNPPEDPKALLNPPEDPEALLNLGDDMVSHIAATLTIDKSSLLPVQSQDSPANESEWMWNEIWLLSLIFIVKYFVCMK